MFTTKALLSLLAVTAGSAVAQDVSTLESLFSAAGIVNTSDALSLQTFSPQGVLDAVYGTTNLSTGQLLTESDVASSPSLSVVPSSDASAFTDGAEFTVILADYDANTTELELAGGQTRHWLVNGATLDTSASPYTVGWTNATSITDYTSPGPFPYSGAHKYTLLLIAQPSTFSAPANLSTAGTALGVFDVNSYISSSGLGDIVAANFFYVDTDPDAPTTISLSTSAVSTATGSAASGSSGASTTGTATGTSKTATGSSSATSAATSSSAAGMKAAVGFGMGGVMAAAVGLVGAAVGSLVVL